MTLRSRMDMPMKWALIALVVVSISFVAIACQSVSKSTPTPEVYVERDWRDIVKEARDKADAIHPDSIIIGVRASNVGEESYRVQFFFYSSKMENLA